MGHKTEKLTFSCISESTMDRLKFEAERERNYPLLLKEVLAARAMRDMLKKPGYDNVIENRRLITSYDKIRAENEKASI